MKIAFINQPLDLLIPPIFPTASVAIVTYQFARHLAKSNDVLVYGSQQLGKRESLCNEGVNYHYVPLNFDARLLKFSKKLFKLLNNGQHFFASYLYYYGYIFQVARHLQREKCDIVHLHNYSQYVPIIRKLNPKIKIVLHMHCEWLTQLDKAVIARRLNDSDLVIGVSEYITNKIRKRFPSLASRCATVYNGVDTNMFKPVNNNGNKRSMGKRLLCIGRMSPEKGWHVLIEAMPEVINRFPETQCEMVGSEGVLPKDLLISLSDDDRVTALASLYQGDYAAHLRNRVVSLNLADRVKFSRPLPHSALVTKYQISDILVQPSFSEAAPLPVLEAMACGLPVVGACVGGIPESVDNGKTGLLVEADDASALAKGIIRLLKNDDLKKSMGRAGRNRAEELFSWELVSENLINLYKKIT
jgi:glycosyltransferase involved in cell wall biosynthesis